MRSEPNRPARRSAKGQAMAIFALVSVLLFVIAGLSVDAGTSYLTSNKLERAAAPRRSPASPISRVTIRMLRTLRSSRLPAMGTPTRAPGTRASATRLRA